MDAIFHFTVNAQPTQITTDASRPLLDVLREELSLTGAKYGCGEGECGACTVLIDGVATRSCMTPIARADGRTIVTIEGLAKDGKLHPVQQAFVDCGAAQCGYCVPGQIMNAVGLLKETPQASREQIVEGMRGNLCRCCNYPDLRAAVERAAELLAQGDRNS
ncbi:MAG TPA: (2Fe-2S)-binding protein [Pirellulales bacterium]|nr:(2Fe-2S)-binding protein [Pirellulales bacterium]